MGSGWAPDGLSVCGCARVRGCTRAGGREGGDQRLPVNLPARPIPEYPERRIKVKLWRKSISNKPLLVISAT
jgi:hypothetical protein